MCGELCTDNRFEIIAAYKKKLIEGTNIEDSPEEMAVIDNILFRFWQMDWLPPVPHGRLLDADDVFHVLTSYYHHSTDFQHEALKEALARVSTIIGAEAGDGYV